MEQRFKNVPDKAEGLDERFFLPESAAAVG
jgi:hypothetical protein